MHFSLPTFALLFASAALASPLADADAGVVPNALQKRGETCAILGNDVQCRKGPGRQYDPVTEFDSDRRIFFGCYKVGESINGNDAWDYSTGWQCYVSARYTGANCNKQTLPRC